MSKHTRTTIPEGVTRVRNAATGEIKSFTDANAKLPIYAHNMSLIKEMAAKIKAEIEVNNDE